ncbi:VanZ family protein [Sulfuriroseicoccus oceanibius]|uniref:VanZ family protein n=1 Tax=Sulfuriroseicoccus oceanibius TaxID=2707525 RepID=A0A6B3L0Z4_9BACT|nr:VanZ family protein [Sulfuriroseicoccus oceanibius]QQL44203.1 VanZ family protein [Sulfuriroseicoccus oceanibius]
MTEPAAGTQKPSIPPLLARWIRRPVFWGLLFIAWYALLYYLSSGPVTVRTGWTIPHADKIIHFLYFAGGGTGLHLLLRFHPRSRELALWKRIAIVTLTIALLGWLDEWHQSTTAQRNGNDIYDWTADVLGGLCSVVIARPIGRFIERKTAPLDTDTDATS